MGCDSHPCIEVKGKNGRWGLKDEKHHYYDMKDAEGNDLSYEARQALKPSYLRVLGDRNYLLFACLADVRNGGWAAQDRFVTPLFAGRGVPNDVTKATMKIIPKDSDYHSHTYFTLRELMETNWDAVAGTRFERVIYADQYMAWKETGLVPDDADEYAQGWDEETREVSHEEMVMLLMSNRADELTKMVPDRLAEHRGQADAPKIRSGPYVKIQTSLTYRQVIGHFIDTIEDLKKLGAPDKVRIVVAFDN